MLPGPTGNPRQLFACILPIAVPWVLIIPMQRNKYLESVNLEDHSHNTLEERGTLQSSGPSECVTRALVNIRIPTKKVLAGKHTAWQTTLYF